jgi:hypothetical protein
MPPWVMSDAPLASRGFGTSTGTWCTMSNTLTTWLPIVIAYGT